MAKKRNGMREQTSIRDMAAYCALVVPRNDARRNGLSRRGRGTRAELGRLAARPRCRCQLDRVRRERARALKTRARAITAVVGKIKSLAVNARLLSSQHAELFLSSARARVWATVLIGRTPGAHVAPASWQATAFLWSFLPYSGALGKSAAVCVAGSSANVRKARRAGSMASNPRRGASGRVRSACRTIARASAGTRSCSRSSRTRTSRCPGFVMR